MTAFSPLVIFAIMRMAALCSDGLRPFIIAEWSIWPVDMECFFVVPWAIAGETVSAAMAARQRSVSLFMLTCLKPRDASRWRSYRGRSRETQAVVDSDDALGMTPSRRLSFHVRVRDTGRTMNQATDHTIAVFATHDQAEAAIKALNDNGYDMKSLSIVGQDFQSEERPVGFVNTGDRMWSWGQYGAFWGSMWGVLFGSAMLVVPGVGPLFLAGWLVAALEGAVIGGGLAALAGALTSVGIPENSVVEYEKELKAGSFIVLAHGSEHQVRKAKDVLSTTLATRVDSYSSSKEPISTRP